MNVSGKTLRFGEEPGVFVRGGRFWVMLCVAFGLVTAGVQLPTVDAVAASDGGRKITPTMRQSVYDHISKAAAYAEEDDYEHAVEELRKAEKTRQATDYELAQIFTAYGYTYYMMNDTARSIEAYESVLAIEGLPEALEASTIYTVAQLQFQLENYERTVELLHRWLDLNESPGPAAYVMLGQTYYALEQYSASIEPISRAIEIAIERGTKPKEQWYLLLRAVHYELEDYVESVRILEILVQQYPRAKYWSQLGAMYGQLDEVDKQLAAYDLAYLQGALDSSAEIVLLAQLLLQAEVPYRSGQILADGMESQVVEKKASNYRLLSQAWSMAKEEEKSVEALRQAAALTEDGEVDAWLAYSYSNLGHWEKCVEAARRAVGKGIDDPGEMHLLTGQALYQLERYVDARDEFGQVLSKSSDRQVAAKWMAHIDAEERRLEELRASLAEQ